MFLNFFAVLRLKFCNLSDVKYANKNIDTLLSNVTSTISSKLVHYRRNLDMLLYLAGKPYDEVVFK